MCLLGSSLLAGAGIWDAEWLQLSEQTWQALILLPVKLECRAGLLGFGLCAVIPPLKS